MHHLAGRQVAEQCLERAAQFVGRCKKPIGSQVAGERAVDGTGNMAGHRVQGFLLAAEALAGNRRMWIEMDKFGVTLPAGRRVVLYRPARQSSVVRKPAWRPGEVRQSPPLGTPESARNYCDCGWPYHLLLPRGTRQGMPFRLMVMLTDWLIDRVGADSACGSLSFCGARDADYPDSRPMGYPFDRPFAGRTIPQMLADPGLRHVASTSVVIRQV